MNLESSIIVTGPDLVALQNKHRAAMVLRKKGEEPVEYNEWLLKELGIEQIQSPKGMWGNEHKLVFISDEALDEFIHRHMGQG